MVFVDYIQFIRQNRTTKPAATTLTILMSLIKIFRLGPLVSLNGSPTVSPTTAALCASEPFACCTPSLSRCPASMYFFALSHAPPAFAMKIATQKPQVSVPTKRPITPPNPQEQSSHDRRDQSQKRWQKHFSLSGHGADCYRTRVIGSLTTVENSWLFTELPANFFYHSLRCTSYRLHRHCTEHERRHAAQEDSHEDHRIQQGRIVILCKNQEALRP